MRKRIRKRDVVSLLLSFVIVFSLTTSISVSADDPNERFCRFYVFNRGGVDNTGQINARAVTRAMQLGFTAQIETNKTATQVKNGFYNNAVSFVIGNGFLNEVWLPVRESSINSSTVYPMIVSEKGFFEADGTETEITGDVFLSNYSSTNATNLGSNLVVLVSGFSASDLGTYVENGVTYQYYNPIQQVCRKCTDSAIGWVHNFDTNGPEIKLWIWKFLKACADNSIRDASDEAIYELNYYYTNYNNENGVVYDYLEIYKIDHNIRYAGYCYRMINA